MPDALTVHSFFYYLTEIEGVEWRTQDWTANKIVHAVKGDPIKGYFDIGVGGKRRTFDQKNISEFLPFLMNTVAARIASLVPGDFIIVPIPNSDATAANREEFRTLAHARQIAAAIGQRATAVPALRWKRAKASARKGGSRDPQVHFENLVIVQKPDKPIVIFDDVMTTGSQMIAASRRLDADSATLSCGVVVGRATKQQRPTMMGWSTEDVPLVERPIDWDAIFGPSA
jgi:hypothetical protein